MHISTKLCPLRVKLPTEIPFVKAVTLRETPTQYYLAPQLGKLNSLTRSSDYCLLAPHAKNSHDLVDFNKASAGPPSRIFSVPEFFSERRLGKGRPRREMGTL